MDLDDGDIDVFGGFAADVFYSTTAIEVSTTNVFSTTKISPSAAIPTTASAAAPNCLTIASEDRSLTSIILNFQPHDQGLDGAVLKSGI